MKSRILSVVPRVGVLGTLSLLVWASPCVSQEGSASSEALVAPGASAQSTPSQAAAQVPGPDGSNAAVLDRAERMAEAKQRFDRGLVLYNDGDPSLALIEFSRAYELVPNYRVLYNIGQVGIQLGQYANARRALERYLKEAGDSLLAERKEEVAADLKMLTGRTALLTVSATVVGADVLVDDIVMGQTPLSAPLLVDAGVHSVVLRLSGYDAHASRITLAGGDDVDVAPPLRKRVVAGPVIVMQEADDDAGRQKNWMTVGWVATGALAAGAVVTGIMGLGEAGENRELAGARAEDTENLLGRLNNSSANARSLFLATDVLAASAVIAGGLSLWLTVSTDKSSTVEDSAVFEPSELKLGYSGGQFQVQGGF